jgi:protein JBTS26
VIQIVSTWGDSNYVGLNGLELFDENGDLLQRDGDANAAKAANRNNNNMNNSNNFNFNSNSNNSYTKACTKVISSIEAFPSDINVLSEFSSDPRKVVNLLDGVNFTRNDLHVWLAPHLRR